MTKSQLSIRSFVAFLGLFLMLFCAVPQMASADVQPPKDPCADDTLTKAFQGAFGNVSQQKTSAGMAVLNSFGTINAEAGYCLQKLRSMIDLITSTATAISLNPFNFIVQQVLDKITDTILDFISSACQQVLGDIAALANFGMSLLNKLCIPMPDLNLGMANLGALSLKASPPCNGMPVFNVPKLNPNAITPGNYRTFGQ